MQEVRDIRDEYDRYKDEMADLAETVEIATLDKEMAEEKASLKMNNTFFFYVIKLKTLSCIAC